MSTPSNWPLPAASIRYLVPKSIVSELSLNPLSRGLYPLAFGYYAHAEQHHVKRTAHSNNLLILCIKGSGKVTTDHLDVNVGAGQILLLPKGTAHEYLADDNKPWTIYWVHMDGHLFEHYRQMLHISERQLTLDITDPTEIIAEFEQLLTSRLSIYQNNKYMVSANILQKMMSLIVCQSQSNVPINAQQLSFKNIDAFLEQRLSQSISLEQMATAAGYSKYHFAKKFQQEMGISPVRYFLELKIKHACELMDRSLLSVKQVAGELGYEDPYYFSRLFKKVMGISPKQYRQSKV
ncbi:MAG: AraC family transcriptional regulator [Gammaproteobacteria bacterium]|nr:AraC family transcriptional regulator [Gammaproteobacteria bacterium]